MAFPFIPFFPHPNSNLSHFHYYNLPFCQYSNIASLFLHLCPNQQKDHQPTDPLSLHFSSSSVMATKTTTTTTTSNRQDCNSQSKPILFSSPSRRHFHLWSAKKKEDHQENHHKNSSTTRSSSSSSSLMFRYYKKEKMINMLSVLKLLRTLSLNSSRAGGRSSRVTGTLFGSRRGHVHLAFQDAGPKSPPSLLIELATPTATLIREMSTGLVRIALECDKKKKAASPERLVDEVLWRTYCNGKRSGYAARRDCGVAEWRVFRAVEPVTAGAGVLPAGLVGGDGELMYMRAQFERVVGSKDSEAYYMLSPDDGRGGSGCPELSIYLLRV